MTDALLRRARLRLELAKMLVYRGVTLDCDEADALFAAADERDVLRARLAQLTPLDGVDVGD